MSKLCLGALTSVDQMETKLNEHQPMEKFKRLSEDSVKLNSQVQQSLHDMHLKMERLGKSSEEIFIILLYISKTTKSRLSFAVSPFHGLSFKARRSKLCMQPPFMRALVLGRSRPASAASEAVS